MKLSRKMKLKFKQFFCNHDEKKTQSWLEKDSINTETRCVKCGKSVPEKFPTSMSYGYQIRLLERAKNLKEGERIDL